MKNIPKLLLSLIFPLILFPTNVWAKGQIVVEKKEGITDVYSAVEIFDTDNIIYFKDPDSDTILMITKNQCDKEGELFVCNKARMGINTYGVIEEIGVQEIVLFINPTDKAQTVQGSKIVMNPKTVLLEASTVDGNFVTGLGRIDSNMIPEEASP